MVDPTAIIVSGVGVATGLYAAVVAQRAGRRSATAQERSNEWQAVSDSAAFLTAELDRTRRRHAEDMAQIRADLDACQERDQEKSGQLTKLGADLAALQVLVDRRIPPS